MAWTPNDVILCAEQICNTKKNSFRWQHTGTSAGYQWKIGSLYPLFINKMRCRFPLATTDMSPNTLCPQMKMILEIFLYTCLKNGHITPWPCPSVHPNFPDIFSTCFEISIWNLVYTFSIWHDMLSFSFITIGSFWLTLQVNVSQTHFFILNHDLINQDKSFKFGT